MLPSIISTMVRISVVAPGRQNIKLHPTTTECFTQIIDTPDGDRLLHISTFGSESRASSPKSSQSMQFDAEAARALISELVNAFGAGVLPKL